MPKERERLKERAKAHEPGRHRGPGRPKTEKWKLRWRDWEKAQDAIQPKEQKIFHAKVERVNLPPTTKTVEIPGSGGKELEVKVTKPS